MSFCEVQAGTCKIKKITSDPFAAVGQMMEGKIGIVTGGGERYAARTGAPSPAPVAKI